MRYRLEAALGHRAGRSRAIRCHSEYRSVTKAKALTSLACNISGVHPSSILLLQYYKLGYSLHCCPSLQSLSAVMYIGASLPLHADHMSHCENERTVVAC